MLDDFQPKKRPSPDYVPRGGGEEPVKFRVGQDFAPENMSRKPDELITPETDESLKVAEAPSEDSGKDQKPPLLTSRTKRSSKKKKIVTIALVVLALAGAGFGAWWFGFRDSGTPQTTTNSSSQEVEEEEKPKDDGLVASPLSGVRVSEADAKRPVTAIMIENSGEARPQSGLRDADVVFEAIAEGGITRFLALFQAKQPDYIGPIRSARPYYVEWAAAFDASYVHAGGSPDGMARIGELGVKDVSAFQGDAFFRTEDRFAPHNLYASFAGLDKINTDKGFTSSTFTPWARKQDVPQAASAKTIDITISAPFYNPHYDYDAATNTYLRSEGGEAHMDEKSGKQLAPNTVLVMVMDRSQSGIYSFYNTTGSGTFLAFQDGVVSQGTWSRGGPKDQYAFKDKYGFDYNFNAGQVWVSIVTEAGDVTYAP